METHDDVDWEAVVVESNAISFERFFMANIIGEGELSRPAAKKERDLWIFSKDATRETCQSALVLRKTKKGSSVEFVWAKVPVYSCQGNEA